MTNELHYGSISKWSPGRWLGHLDIPESSATSSGAGPGPVSRGLAVSGLPDRRVADLTDTCTRAARPLGNSDARC